MSIKTIAVDIEVYRRLAGLKGERESFSKLIDRLLTEVETSHTGRDILRGLAGFSPLSAEESERFLEVVADARATEPWTPGDLR